MIRSARGKQASGYSGPSSRVLKLIDFYTWELTLKDEDPAAVPQLSLSHSRPVEVRSWRTFEQTVTFGSKPLEAGDRILLGKDGFNDQGALQTEDPAGDNYVSIRSSNPQARFVSGPANAGISLPSRVVATFTLEGAEVGASETVTIVYGDRSGGSRGFEIQTYTVDEFLLPVYIDFDKQGFGISPDWPKIELVGKGAVERVSVVAPSVVEPGETFELSIRSGDIFYNRASANIPAYEVILNGESFRSIPSGDNGLTVLSNCHIGAEGVYRFEVRSVDGKFAVRSNPIWVKEDPGHRIYWGDTHAHTRYAEGQGSPNGFFQFARDDARLDFVTLSEHDLWLDAFEWRTLNNLAKKYFDKGRFIPILGFEWTTRPSGGGHHNVLFRDLDQDVVGGQVAENLTALYEELKSRYAADDVMTIPHAHAPGDWTNSDHQVERLVEIASVHGTFEFFGNRYLQNGWQVGFIGSTDNHHSHPGYSDTGTTFHTERNGLAAVLAPEKSRDAIFSAMRDIRAYGTSGERMILDVEMDGRPMGTRLPVDTERRITSRVMGTAAIDTIDVIKNGRVVFSRNYAAGELASTTWVQVAISSSSDVFTHRPPRQYRTWQGSLEVKGATIADFDPISFDNMHQEWARRDADNDGRIEFRTLTRGRSDVLLLELEGVAESTTIEFNIEPDRISRGGGEFEEIPAVRVVLRLGDAVDGRLAHRIELPSTDAGHTNNDAIALQIFDVHAGLDQQVEFTDRSRAEPGDYYYVRATQIDGERARSSPFWVGGEAR